MACKKVPSHSSHAAEALDLEMTSACVGEDDHHDKTDWRRRKVRGMPLSYQSCLGKDICYRYALAYCAPSTNAVSLEAIFRKNYSLELQYYPPFSST